jgi:hypothetical protein
MSLIRLPLIVAATMLALSAPVYAAPILQLDIIGGHYDQATETIVSDGPNFTLVALLTPRSWADRTALLAETYYISASVSPQLYTSTPLGTLTWNDSTLSVTDDMVFGTPPIEEIAAANVFDSGDLSKHGIYPTYFTEFDFTFSADLRATTYNTADDPGGPTASSVGTSFYQTFTVALDLPGPYQIHFDLYDTLLSECLRNRTCVPDEDIDHFAPFSHDAQSGPSLNSPPAPPVVPEPATIATMTVGLTLTGLRALRRRQPPTVPIGELT